MSIALRARTLNVLRAFDSSCELQCVFLPPKLAEDGGTNPDLSKGGGQKTWVVGECRR